jgi:putative component of membrane protein insertase Oxa1/YidC/SpoIIIJ protein YidD
MDPWAFERPVETVPPREHVHEVDDPALSSNPVKLGFGFMFNVWRDVLSKLDGPKCPHYPTCSQFSRESIGRYGPAWGLVMTGNRLAREYPSLLEDGHYKVIFLGQPRAFDPPEQEWLWGEYLNPPYPKDPE